ncbi:hypothetical protein D4T97_019020 [Siminovitchia acidinfaciens]|uniref:XdhC Rossmann domain-containing protein n=1 Tax=Siminovitchia acidinfaciens TaxID=2321395 RepID=A0A429XTZ6_9BACI|nr:hypothetical protein D4T97_019020 [Siminovitchia acidinfaciens]
MDEQMYAELLKSIKDRQEDVALITVTKHPDDAIIGAKLLLREDGILMSDGACSDGLQTAIINSTLLAFKKGRSKTVQFEYEQLPIECYMEFFLVPPRLIVAGAGHVSEPVAEIGKMTGFHVTVIDDRPEFANKERFPMADEVVCSPYIKFFKSIHITSNTFIVLLTRGHKFDVVSLQELLRREEEIEQEQRTAYIGMIGSRRRISGVFEQLKDEFSEHNFTNIYSPVGLDIGGQTPAEIAVSIMAEILKVKNGRSGNSLKEKISSYSHLKFRERVKK